VLRLSERLFLYSIDDGEWHSLSDVARDLDWPMERVVKAAEYFSQGRIIHYDEEKGQVRLQAWLMKFPRGEWVKPGKRSTGSVIISPEGTVTLQETMIQNWLDFDIEVGFRVVDEKLEELVISKLEQGEETSRGGEHKRLYHS